MVWARPGFGRWPRETRALVAPPWVMLHRDTSRCHAVALGGRARARRGRASAARRHPDAPPRTATPPRRAPACAPPAAGAARGCEGLRVPHQSAGRRPNGGGGGCRSSRARSQVGARANDQHGSHSKLPRGPPAQGAAPPLGAAPAQALAPSASAPHRQLQQRPQRRPPGGARTPAREHASTPARSHVPLACALLPRPLPRAGRSRQAARPPPQRAAPGAVLRAVPVPAGGAALCIQSGAWSGRRWPMRPDVHWQGALGRLCPAPGARAYAAPSTMQYVLREAGAGKQARNSR
jgi:hypothetical protein